ncbi:VanZ family protein [Massilia sp. NR 4-1]|uniref:VanZ family protein n=1 Tax=Massilia sp. NR 4-1 TaxID=1678028 RepID=UPI00067DCD99|nr:VanZ family protein [Massilia sp. NR 4-1]AKU24024.1 hypothetical protein ACZ75_23765 [Massilia sp. NR 4-1]
MAWEWICFGLALAGVALGCLLPAGWLPLLPHDKLLHFLAFAGLTVLAGRIAPDWAQLQYWLLGLLVAGWLIEVLQKLVPGRSFCWRDLAANAAGIAVAASAILLVQAI